MGVDSDAVHTANYRYTVYQALMRCSARNPKDHHPKNIVVMDRATADWLALLFPGATVCAMAGLPAQLPIGKPGRTKTHKNSAARVNACRANERMRLLDELASINPDSFSNEPYRVGEKMGQKSCNEMTTTSGDFVTGKTSYFSCADHANKSIDINSGFSDPFSNEPYRVGRKWIKNRVTKSLSLQVFSLQENRMVFCSPTNTPSSHCSTSALPAPTSS